MGEGGGRSARWAGVYVVLTPIKPHTKQSCGLYYYYHYYCYYYYCSVLQAPIRIRRRAKYKFGLRRFTSITSSQGVVPMRFKPSTCQTHHDLDHLDNLDHLDPTSVVMVSLCRVWDGTDPTQGTCAFNRFVHTIRVSSGNTIYRPSRSYRPRICLSDVRNYPDPCSSPPCKTSTGFHGTGGISKTHGWSRVGPGGVGSLTGRVRSGEELFRYHGAGPGHPGTIRLVHRKVIRLVKIPVKTERDTDDWALLRDVPHKASLQLPSGTRLLGASDTATTPIRTRQKQASLSATSVYFPRV